MFSIFTNINSLRRRAKRTDTLLSRFIKRKAAANSILQAGIDQAQAEINANRLEINEASEMQEHNERLL